MLNAASVDQNGSVSCPFGFRGGGGYIPENLENVNCEIRGSISGIFNFPCRERGGWLQPPQPSPQTHLCTAASVLHPERLTVKIIYYTHKTIAALVNYTCKSFIELTPESINFYGIVKCQHHDL